MRGLKDRFVRLATNLKGWRGKEKLLVFESDDWGATRIRDRKTFEGLLGLGLKIKDSAYDALDCLETRSDLEALCNVLSAHRNRDGMRPVFTLNTIMGNPDFDAIGSADYREFHHENLFGSYERFNGERLEATWKKAMDEGLVKPQFHGREHLNVRLWLDDLASGREDTRIAFDHQYYGLPTQTSNRFQKNYLAEFWTLSPSHLSELADILKDGLTQFETMFGFRSKSFVACNYVRPRELDSILSDQGVRLIQGQRGHISPNADGKGYRVERQIMGQRNAIGQLYTIRNVAFEPFESDRIDWVDAAFDGIRAAFRIGAPAVVSTHRVNYVSGMSVAHRDRCLGLLDRLLTKALKTWPDVRFLTSDQLGYEIGFPMKAH